MCKGKKSMWMGLFLCLHLDTLKLCVSLGQCCQPEGFARCEGVYRSGRDWSCWPAFLEGNLLVTVWISSSPALDEPEVFISVAGFGDPNHIVITALFGRHIHRGHWGLLGGYWSPNRKAGVAPRVSQPCNLPLTLASCGHLGNRCVKQVKRYHFLRTFFSFWQSTVLRFSERKFATRLWWINDELISRSIYRTLEIFLP